MTPLTRWQELEQEEEITGEPYAGKDAQAVIQQLREENQQLHQTIRDMRHKVEMVETASSQSPVPLPRTNSPREASVTQTRLRPLPAPRSHKSIADCSRQAAKETDNSEARYESPKSVDDEQLGPPIRSPVPLPRTKSPREASVTQTRLRPLPAPRSHKSIADCSRQAAKETDNSEARYESPKSVDDEQVSASAISDNLCRMSLKSPPEGKPAPYRSTSPSHPQSKRLTQSYPARSPECYTNYALHQQRLPYHSPSPVLSFREQPDYTTRPYHPPRDFIPDSRIPPTRESIYRGGQCYTSPLECTDSIPPTLRFHKLLITVLQSSHVASLRAAAASLLWRHHSLMGQASPVLP
ncbi:hypothetical protein DPX16_11033 [Anabarilius grahami]|uniref:Uncharacterized protein n=1 Tax=Anabarilius grahami TaxID=495550 RepID=A0A3N0Y205_ANAGA|nr:hypothetical protein DPX16_11033 [Anabarilius grahami]